MRKKRIPPEIFNIPVQQIKKGYFSDKYFYRTKQILEKDNNHIKVLMQIFCRKKASLCGIDEAIAILKLCSDSPQNLTIKALYDGDEIFPEETVMTIEGDYSTFAHLETIYLGVLARGTSIATATRKVVQAAGDRPVLFFPARFDHYWTQFCAGYAAWIGGADSVSTDAQGQWWGSEGMGTIPHGLIAAYKGDTVRAAEAFDKYIPADVKRIVLVDFDADCINTSLAVAKSLGEKLWGVRFDIAQDVKDKSVDCSGVCEELCQKARREFDKAGFSWIKIIISSGFDEGKIKKFVREKVPFDAVGVGSSLLKERIDFTADVVLVEGRACSKVGRKFNPNPRLELVI